MKIKILLTISINFIFIAIGTFVGTILLAAIMYLPSFVKELETLTAADVVKTLLGAFVGIFLAIFGYGIIIAIGFFTFVIMFEGICLLFLKRKPSYISIFIILLLETMFVLFLVILGGNEALMAAGFSYAISQVYRARKIKGLLEVKEV